ncbi:hypothetical protein [Geosporobacter ferrireducens]|uniref:hypothetical protein n=1 Tax=Geosporobacter ferrireducens TaxID=1424294 RepID=UPI00235780D4|nr:hypothetical protein [Geosporobacter ferrireducens]
MSTPFFLVVFSTFLSATAKNILSSSCTPVNHQFLLIFGSDDKNYLTMVLIAGQLVYPTIPVLPPLKRFSPYYIVMKVNRADTRPAPTIGLLSNSDGLYRDICVYMVLFHQNKNR